MGERAKGRRLEDVCVSVCVCARAFGCVCVCARAPACVLEMCVLAEEKGTGGGEGGRAYAWGAKGRGCTWKKRLRKDAMKLSS